MFVLCLLLIHRLIVDLSSLFLFSFCDKQGLLSDNVGLQVAIDFAENLKINGQLFNFLGELWQDIHLLTNAPFFQYIKVQECYYLADKKCNEQMIFSWIENFDNLFCCKCGFHICVKSNNQCNFLWSIIIVSCV